MSTVSSLGYRMPAEWHPHTRCFMGWPCRIKTWGEGMATAKLAYAQVAKAIRQFEPVVMTARPEDAEEARSMCGKTIEVLEIPMNDSWSRDSGPTFVINHKNNVAGIDWEFNQWGADYPDIEDDADFAKRLLDRYGIHCFPAPFVLEGGSIHVDGDGTLLTTEQCLLNPNRNPDLEQGEIEQLLKDFLGIHHLIWLGDGLLDDETAGHVDNIACFVKPGVVPKSTAAINSGVAWSRTLRARSTDRLPTLNIVAACACLTKASPIGEACCPFSRFASRPPTIAL